MGNCIGNALAVYIYAEFIHIQHFFIFLQISPMCIKHKPQAECYITDNILIFTEILLIE